jgi:quercetin dioxygenase-like cupin family protein
MNKLPLLTSLALCGVALAQTPTPNLGAAVMKSPPLSTKIVIVGSLDSQKAGEANISNTIPLLAAWLIASPLFAGADVLSYTNGWPADPAVLEGASSIVCYFDGNKAETVNDPARIAAIGKLMDNGTGLVCLGRSATVSLAGLLGAGSEGAPVTETLTLQPASPEHPISSGVDTFTCTDEFSPALISGDGKQTTPILRSAKAGQVPGWAYDRPGGGRGFGFTGGHSIECLHSPQLQKLLVNAIAWSAKIDVPKDGIATPEPVVSISSVNKMADNKVVEMPWGRLRWYTSAELKNSRTMTTGVAIISPGKSNPRHLHPNCDEVLHVVSGKISHTMNEVTVEMHAGDTVSIPQGVLHNATNIGSEDAVLAISFSSAYREAVGY